MTIQEAIEALHSVRAYKTQPLAEDVVKVLEEQITVLEEGIFHDWLHTDGFRHCQIPL